MLANSFSVSTSFFLIDIQLPSNSQRGIEVMHVLVNLFTPDQFRSDECWTHILLAEDYDFVCAMRKRRGDAKFEVTPDLLKIILTRVRNPCIIRLFMSFDDLPYQS